MAAVAVASIVFLALRMTAGPPAPLSVSDTRRSIAVLPFTDLSPDSQKTYFSDGITEDITAQLANIAGLRVASSTSAARYARIGKSVGEIAAELGVDHVLEGSVRLDGDRVRVVAQLIHAGNNSHLWAQTYDRSIEDIFAVQSDVARNIASALQAELTQAELERIQTRPTENLEAYDLYLKGRGHYFLYDATENDRAIDQFLQAQALDPKFALAYAGYADSLGQRALYQDSAEDIERAIDAARAAISLDPGSGQSYKALGLAYLHSGRLELALEANLKALELNPSLTTALGNNGIICLHQGRLDASLEWALTALDNEPGDVSQRALTAFSYSALRDWPSSTRWLSDSGLGLISFIVSMNDLLAQGRFSEAVHLGERARERHGELPRTDLYLATARLFANDLGASELAYGKYQDVELPLIMFLGVFPNTALGHIALAQGDPTAANTYLERGLRQDMDAVQRGRETWSFLYDAASIHALRGETDQALEWLGEAVEAGWRGWPFRDSPLFASLRGDPRYARILEQVDRKVAEARIAAGVD